MKRQHLATEVKEEDEHIYVDKICNSLRELGLIKSAKQINALYYVDEDNSEPGIHLIKESIIEYFEFAKNKYIAKEPGMSLNNEGDLSAYWELSKNECVVIVFQKKNLKYYFDSDDSIIESSATNSNIIQFLVDNQVSRS